MTHRTTVLLLSGGAILAGLVLALSLSLSAQPQSAGRPIRTPPVGPPAADLVHGRSLGDPDAPVHVEIWADFQCPACGLLARTIEPRLRETYVADGTVKVTYRDLAFLGPESVDAAVAARISEDIGPGFWPYHDLLFANQRGENRGAFDRDRLTAMAGTLGMDEDAFRARLDDPELQAAVQAEVAVGGQLGIDQTPTLVIDGRGYAGVPDWKPLAQLIDQLAADAG